MPDKASGRADDQLAECRCLPKAASKAAVASVCHQNMSLVKQSNTLFPERVSKAVLWGMRAARLQVRSVQKGFLSS